jgi:hypothetical protein
MRNSKMRDNTRKYLLSTAAMLAVVATVASIRPVAADADDHHGTNPNNLKTKTPIKQDNGRNRSGKVRPGMAQRKT